MAETVLDTGAPREEAAARKVKSIRISLDEDVAEVLELLRTTLDFPIENMIAESLRPFIKAFRPAADLHKQGKLSMDCLSELQYAMTSLMVRTEVDKAHFDKDIKEFEKKRQKEQRDNK